MTGFPGRFLVLLLIVLPSTLTLVGNGKTFKKSTCFAGSLCSSKNRNSSMSSSLIMVNVHVAKIAM